MEVVLIECLQGADSGAMGMKLASSSRFLSGSSLVCSLVLNLAVSSAPSFLGESSSSIRVFSQFENRASRFAANSLFWAPGLSCRSSASGLESVPSAQSPGPEVSSTEPFGYMRF